jgi:hypothetical protein
VTPPAPDLDAPLVNVVVPPALWDLVTRTPARRRTTPDPPGDRPGRPVPAPTDLPAFPEARRAREKTPMPGGRMRRRWRQPDGTILEWDYLHGAVERYSRRGRHLGEFDPVTGAQTKPADPTRSVEP